MRGLRLVHRVAETALRLERRVDALYRDPLDRVFREPLFELAQVLVNARRAHDRGLGLAEERVQPGEAADTQQVIELMSQFLHRTYAPGFAERAGNTKTYGVVRGEFRSWYWAAPPSSLPASIATAVSTSPTQVHGHAGRAASSRACPRRCATACSRAPGRSWPGCASPAPAPSRRRTSTTTACSASRSRSWVSMGPS